MQVCVQREGKEDRDVRGGEAPRNGKASQRRNSMCHFYWTF